MTQFRQQRFKTPNITIKRSLSLIFGVGSKTAGIVCFHCGILEPTPIGWLTESQFLSLTSWLEEKNIQKVFIIDLSLKQFKKENLAKLVSIRSYRGSRRVDGLPSRGQNTKSNAKTSKKRKNR